MARIPDYGGGGDGDAILAALDGLAKGFSQAVMHREGQKTRDLELQAKQIEVDRGKREADAAEQEMSRRQRMKQLDSPETIAAQARYKSLGLPVAPTDTADILERTHGSLDKLTFESFSEGLRGKNRMKEKEYERDTELFKLGLKGKKSGLDALPSDAKNRVGLIATALKNLTDYETTFASGARPSRLNADTPYVGPLVSDTEITKSARQMNEAIGRLNSGGVIGPEELVTFRAMLPRAADDEKVARQKILDFREALEARLLSYGVKGVDLEGAGFNLSKLGYDDVGVKRRVALMSSDDRKNVAGPQLPSIFPDAQAEEPKTQDFSLTPTHFAAERARRAAAKKTTR